MSDIEVGSVWTFEENKEAFEVIIEKVVTIDGHIVQLSYTLPSGETIKEVALGYFLRTFRFKDDSEKELLEGYLSSLKPEVRAEVEGRKDDSAKERKHSHYFKPTKEFDEIDTYLLCRIWKVKDDSGALHHALKKMLDAGKRGNKDKLKDIREARDTLNRYLEIEAMFESMEDDK